MLADFETRLADVLGSRLPAPLGGRVDVAPGRDVARLIVAVRATEPIDDDLLSERPERVPGAADPRRVLRLRCEVGIETRGVEGDRDGRMAALDRVLYLLEDPALRSGAALLPADNSDPGFLIRRLRVRGVAPPDAITLSAEGLFWPVGAPGEEGRAIAAILLRAPLLPLTLRPVRPVLTAGGAAIDLAIETASAGGGRIEADGLEPAGALSILVRLIDSGGRPGAGSLAGGAAGPGDSRRLTLTTGIAELNYTPPPDPALDILVVALDGADRPGVELARFALAVRPA